MARPNDVAVLNAFQAAGADVLLSGGKLMLNDGSNDLLNDEVVIVNATGYTKTAFTAGVAKVVSLDLNGVSLLANTSYRVAVVFPKRQGFNNEQVIDNGGRQEANQLIAIREYIVSSGAVAPTATALAALFIDRINNDLGAIVTAAAGVAGVFTLTQDDVNDGEFYTEEPAGAVATVTTPYTAPAGTPELVEVDAPNQSNPAGEYTTYDISVNILRRNNAVSGGQVFFPEVVRVYAEENALNFAAFETALDDVLDGTHTPVSDYLGV